MNEISLLSAFIMGLVGSGHCIVMCGGVASSLQLASKNLSSIKVSLAYNLGRVSSYCIAGMLVATLGASFAKQNTHFALGVKIFSGIFMILLALYVMRLANTLKFVESMGKTLLWQHIVKFNKFFLPVDNLKKAFGYGMLWGWLPCGLVYSALIWTLQANSALHGASIMMAFALGTLPAMLTIGQSAQHLSRFLNHNLVRLALGSIFVWYGFYLLIIATDKLVH